jgi:hypothetical protein
MVNLFPGRRADLDTLRNSHVHYSVMERLENVSIKILRTVQIHAK